MVDVPEFLSSIAMRFLCEVPDWKRHLTLHWFVTTRNAIFHVLELGNPRSNINLFKPIYIIRSCAIPGLPDLQVSCYFLLSFAQVFLRFLHSPQKCPLKEVPP